jgi:hypothetical protein
MTLSVTMENDDYGFSYEDDVVVENDATIANEYYYAKCKRKALLQNMNQAVYHMEIDTTPWSVCVLSPCTRLQRDDGCTMCV